MFIHLLFLTSNKPNSVKCNWDRKPNRYISAAVYLVDTFRDRMSGIFKILLNIKRDSAILKANFPNKL